MILLCAEAPTADREPPELDAAALQEKYNQAIGLIAMLINPPKLSTPGPSMPQIAQAWMNENARFAR